MENGHVCQIVDVSYRLVSPAFQATVPLVPTVPNAEDSDDDVEVLRESFADETTTTRKDRDISATLILESTLQKLCVRDHQCWLTCLYIPICLQRHCPLFLMARESRRMARTGPETFLIKWGDSMFGTANLYIQTKLQELLPEVFP